MADSDSGLFGALPRQTRGVILGGLFIAWGIIGALFDFGGTGSFYLPTSWDFSENAIRHAVLWIGAGALVIIYSTIGSGSSRRDPAEDDDVRDNELRNHHKR